MPLFKYRACAVSDFDTPTHLKKKNLGSICFVQLPLQALRHRNSPNELLAVMGFGGPKALELTWLLVLVTWGGMSGSF